MTRAKQRPRGFYGRLARARGVPVHVVYRELNPDTRPCVRAQQECDASWPWSRDDLVRMDRAFCDAVRREIARGTERPRGVTFARRAPTTPWCAGELSTKQSRAECGVCERRG